MDTAVKPQGCTNLKLRQFMRRMNQHYDLEMAQVGLKTTQFSLLSCVDKLGPLRPGDLAAGLKMDASTLTRNLQPLLAAGWLLQAAGADARSRVITLTPAGRDKQAEALAHWKAAQLNVNATLGAERVTALHTLLDDCMALLGTETHPS